MPINRFDRREPYDLGLYTPPIDVVKEMLAVTQQRYDTNLNVAETIKSTVLPALPQDAAEARRIQEEWAAEVDNMVAKHNGDYSKATRDVQSLTRKVQRDLQHGKPGAIVGNYERYQQWLANQRERLEKGKIIADDLNLANDYYMKTYKGVGELDPVTGNYGLLNPEEVTEYQSPDAIINEVYKSFKPQSYERSETVFQNGLQTDKTVKYEGIDPNRLYPAFASALEHDPKLATNMMQRAKFMGVDPQTIWNNLGEYSAQRAQALGYLNRSEGSKSQRDPLALIQARGAQDRATAKYKQDLKDISTTNLFKGLYQWEPSTGTINATEPDINPKDWRRGFTGAVPMIPMSSSPSGAVYNKALAEGVANDQKLPSDMTLEQFLNSPKATDRGVHTPLAKQMLADMKADLGPAFNKNYMKNKVWTQRFEEDYWTRYKEAHKATGASAAKTLQIPQVSVPGLLKNIIPDIASGNAIAYKPGDKLAQRMSSLGDEYKKAILTDDGKIRQDVGVRYAFKGTPGFPEGGFLIQTSAGPVVIVDQEVSRQALQNVLGSGINPIYREGKTTGNPMVIGSGQNAQGQVQDIVGVPKVKYFRDASGNYQAKSYFSTSPNTDDVMTFIDPSTGVERPLSIDDVLNQYAPQFQSMLDLGASKADLTPNALYNMIQSLNNED